MGKMKYLNLVMKLFEKSHIVDFASIKKIVKNDAYAKLLIHNLVANGRVYKLTKGIYTKHSNSELAVFAFKPAYFGLQDALSFHNIWEQETIPVIVTSRLVRTGLRSILGSNVLIRHINQRLFFGYEYIARGDIAYPYSDIEKTLIDLVFFKETIDSNVLKKLRASINRDKLSKYLKRCDKKTREKVIGIVK